MQSLITSESPTDSTAQYTGRPLRADQARDAASEFLTALDPPAAESTAQNLLLLVSELVTNALRHAGAVSSLKLRADHVRIQVTVEDPSPTRPQGRAPDWTGRTGGFGWPMVQRLAQSLTVVPAHPGAGKAIIAALAR
ncbi:ATP-binding protein [Streptomyces sp. CA-243310]|uniref:ATP-binding protein n=1 Tax=Streptomyces sp. CA-243310 TaxID=3240056 RepID=UPI003D8EC326